MQLVCQRVVEEEAGRRGAAGCVGVCYEAFVAAVDVGERLIRWRGLAPPPWCQEMMLYSFLRLAGGRRSEDSHWGSCRIKLEQVVFIFLSVSFFIISIFRFIWGGGGV